MDFRDLERGLRTFEVEVRYRSGGPSSLHSVKLKPNETFKKIKRHITESLDIQGKLTYRETNLDDYASKRLAEIYFEGEKFYLVADKKPRELKHSVELKLPSVDGKEERTESIKIARTTTVGNLKHKIQDEFAIPVEELAIHNIPSQQKECHQETNVMRLSKVLEVRLVSSPAKKAQPARASIVRGTPYDTRQSAHVSKRKGYDGGGIHPKTFTKFKEKEKLAEIEEVQSDVTVSIQQAPYETIHQLGRNLEQLQGDKSKKLVVEVAYKDDAKMSIKSKLAPNDTTG